MKSFFGVIFIFLAIVFICTTIFAGFKALCLRIIDRIRENVQSYRNDASAIPAAIKNRMKPRKRDLMKVISLTTGQCESCGRTFIGTTDDEDCPLNEIEFMGEQKTLCTDCFEKLMQDFRRSGQSDEKWFSKNAQHLKNILSDCINRSK